MWQAAAKKRPDAHRAGDGDGRAGDGGGYAGDGGRGGTRGLRVQRRATAWPRSTPGWRSSGSPERQRGHGQRAVSGRHVLADQDGTWIVSGHAGGLAPERSAGQRHGAAAVPGVGDLHARPQLAQSTGGAHLPGDTVTVPSYTDTATWTRSVAPSRRRRRRRRSCSPTGCGRPRFRPARRCGARSASRPGSRRRRPLDQLPAGTPPGTSSSGRRGWADRSTACGRCGCGSSCRSMPNADLAVTRCGSAAGPGLFRLGGDLLPDAPMKLYSEIVASAKGAPGMLGRQLYRMLGWQLYCRPQGPGAAVQLPHQRSRNCRTNGRATAAPTVGATAAPTVVWQAAPRRPAARRGRAGRVAPAVAHHGPELRGDAEPERHGADPGQCPERPVGPARRADGDHAGDQRRCT